MTSEEVVNEAWKYRTWMMTSGGGITLSGGEPLVQSDFVLDIIRRAHSKKISVALDTSGYGNLSRTHSCLDEADLVLLDIKTALPEKHKNLTGISAEQPLATLAYLKEIKKPLWIRHVIVPGLTDGKENLAALKKLLMDIPFLERFEFLPFHKMGEGKWAQLGAPYTLTDTQPPEEGFIEEISREFARAGIPMRAVSQELLVMT